MGQAINELYGIVTIHIPLLAATWQDLHYRWDVRETHHDLHYRRNNEATERLTKIFITDETGNLSIHRTRFSISQTVSTRFLRMDISTPTPAYWDFPQTAPKRFGTNILATSPAYWDFAKTIWKHGRKMHGFWNAHPSTKPRVALGGSMLPSEVERGGGFWPALMKSHVAHCKRLKFVRNFVRGYFVSCGEQTLLRESKVQLVRLDWLQCYTTTMILFIPCPNQLANVLKVRLLFKRVGFVE